MHVKASARDLAVLKNVAIAVLALTYQLVQIASAQHVWKAHSERTDGHLEMRISVKERAGVASGLGVERHEVLQSSMLLSSLRALGSQKLLYSAQLVV